MSSNLIVISGPSGCGKSTLIRRLLKKHREQLLFSTSHTTRPRREREVEARDYYFVSPEQFLEMMDNEEFVEWAEVYGNYYGTSHREIETKARQARNRFLVLDLDVQGAGNIKKIYPDALFVFVVPPSMEELERRLVGREKTMDLHVQKRLEIAREELKEYPLYDYVIMNKKLETAFYILNAIYTAHRNTTARREWFVKNLLEGGEV